jgi:ferredoxin-type protein NapG
MKDRAEVSRRDFLFLKGILRSRGLALAGTGGIVWAHLVNGSRGRALAPRPPGARDEADFVATCTKCGQCVEACPYDTLKLATAGSDVAIGTPSFEPREVPCYMCEDTPCIEACPTGSLVQGTAIEDARMGLAVLSDQENCIAFQGLRCEVCYRACPLLGKALTLEFEPQERTGKHAFFLPVVHSEACTGCGVCEHACILEEAAIKVLPHDLAQGKPNPSYRFGWREEAKISPDFQPSDSDAPPGAWQDNTDRVLTELAYVEGIEEP